VPAAAPIAVLQQQDVGVRRGGRQSVVAFFLQNEPNQTQFKPNFKNISSLVGLLLFLFVLGYNLLLDIWRHAFVMAK